MTRSRFKPPVLSDKVQSVPCESFLTRSDLNLTCSCVLTNEVIDLHVLRQVVEIVVTYGS